jgi:hypothetical protein
VDASHDFHRLHRRGNLGHIHGCTVVRSDAVLAITISGRP